MAVAPFNLNPDLDVEALAADFARSNRVHVANFLLDADAERLHRHLKNSGEWRLIINQDDKVFELDRPAQASMSAEARANLDLAVKGAARYGFQHLYEAIRVADEEEARRAAGDELNAFASFLSSPPALSLFRKITGEEAIDFADAQATAYGLGHFLTAHDDDVSGKNRRAAYVFNLTPQWRIDWGGLLMFHGEGARVDEAYSPTFNAINLFKVPQVHSVSMVAPFAAARRYSVTGWLRSFADDPSSWPENRAGTEAGK